MHSIRIHSEVEDALRDGAPVVALESAVITAGLPHEPLPAASILRTMEESFQRFTGLTDWAWEDPVNLELACAMERAVRNAGAVPATIAIIEGDLCIGLHDDELVMLATDKCAGKASVTDLASIMTAGGTAGVTVSATLAAIAVVHRHSSSANPSVFATGGIGGVHRNWQRVPDVSADLRQLANTRACVVSSGAKSLLDLPATLETLESLGVPVVGYRTDCFPQFQCPGDASLPLRAGVDDAQRAAQLCRAHWDSLHVAGGVLLCNPVPEEFAMRADELEAAVQQAESAASAKQIAGAQRTPFVLAEIARLTDGRSLDANLALLLSNAQLAGQLAVSLAAR